MPLLTNHVLRAAPFRLCALLCLVALALPQIALAQKAHPTTVELYQNTVQAFNRGQIGDGGSRVAAIQHPLLRKLAQGALMAQPDNPYDFAALSAFISANPSWPELDLIVKQAEAKLPAGMSDAQLLRWFAAHAPQTQDAFDLMIKAQRATGQRAAALTAIRARWISGAFGSVEQSDFLKRYRGDLAAKDHWARLDRLLWDNTTAAAERMLPLVSKGQAALARARLHFNKRTLAKVPSALQHDPGLLLLKIKKARQDEADDTAAVLLAQQPRDHAHDDAWWNERSIIARRFLVKGAPQRAYQIAARHRLQDGMPFTQAEFLAGWIALRFLDKPTIAMGHFQTIYEKSNYPISRSRGAYWSGRADAAQGQTEAAEDWYRKAAAYPTTFYGQLAQSALTDEAVLAVTPPAIPAEDREAFAASENVRIVVLLQSIGEARRAEQFLLAMAAEATTANELTLLAQLANAQERYDLAVRISKRATQRGFLLEADAYPVPDYLWADAPERALVLGIIRQESMFNPTIVSPAQAVGLMQLLPSTGRAVAKQLGQSFSTQKLTDPNTNIRLGSRFLADRIAQFGGSKIMAIAAYNAGPARVRQWVEKIGDPRAGRDPIDWIELIPVYETRNYVQRVLEATQIYRARLQSGKAGLRLRDDLAAGKAD